MGDVKATHRQDALRNAAGVDVAAVCGGVHGIDAVLVLGLLDRQRQHLPAVQQGGASKISGQILQELLQKNVEAEGT